MEEIIYSQNINSTIFCYSMDFSGISKQNAHGERNVLPKMFVGRWWYFLEKCWKTGWSVRIRTATHFSLENSHRETSHRGRTFRSPWAFVRFTTALRYEPCTQFINVSQRTLHIYFIDGCRRIKSKTKTATCEQAPRSLFLFWLCMARNSQFKIMSAAHISRGIHAGK